MDRSLHSNDHVDRAGLVEWLLENGGPIIRYRAARELLDDPASVDVESLEHDLLRSPSVQQWLALLPREFPRNQDGRLDTLHGGKDEKYETAMGKLIHFGFHAGMPGFDEKTRLYRRWLRDTYSDAHPFDTFAATIVAAFLSMGGYSGEPEVDRMIRYRVEALFGFTRKKDYDIYVPWEHPYKMPSGARGKPLIDPMLYEDGHFRLPWIHDINAIRGLPEEKREGDPKIAAIIEYILEPEYQKLPGYTVLWRSGVLDMLWRPNKRWMMMGWSVPLPGYFEEHLNDLDDRSATHLILSVLMMAHFKSARSHPWFVKCLEHLETFRIEDGFYSFPRRYLKETRPGGVGYWVSGQRMGLEEERRSRLALQLESTFWMLKIKSVR